jgi:hypothetical protein
MGWPEPLPLGLVCHKQYPGHKRRNIFAPDLCTKVLRAWLGVHIVVFKQVRDKPICLPKNRMNRRRIDLSVMHHVVSQFVDALKDFVAPIDWYFSPRKSGFARSRPRCPMDFAV